MCWWNWVPLTPLTQKESDQSPAIPIAGLAIGAGVAAVTVAALASNSPKAEVSIIPPPSSQEPVPSTVDTPSGDGVDTPTVTPQVGFLLLSWFGSTKKREILPSILNNYSL